MNFGGGSAVGNAHKNKISYVLVFLAILLATVWPLAVQADQGAEEAEKDYLIGVGDVLEVQVWQEPDLSRTVTVRLDGKISLPLAGDVQAAGRTTGALDQFLEEKIADLVTEPAVSVMLVENRSRRYYVVGQVGQPGEFPIEFPLTILQAIARSGGFQEWAKREEIKIIRRQGGKEEFLSFDYDGFTKGKNLEQNVLIVPGDTIIVP
ncbi:MAG: polysaccharide export protein [Desulfurivibrio sp.]|jgi:polysaccharide export outer membrane protein|nr:MAG: polysaccharide export protein [Desulfurivibrio sp.]